MEDTANQSPFSSLEEKAANKLKAKIQSELGNVRFKLLRKYPFFGNVAMRLNIYAVHDESYGHTACTNYESIFFDIEFYKECSEAERLFVYAHELGHNIMLHDVRKGGRDHDLWNIAADIEINEHLVGEGFSKLEKGMYRDKFPKMPVTLKTAEEFYDWLKKNPPPQPPNPWPPLPPGWPTKDNDPGKGKGNPPPFKKDPKKLGKLKRIVQQAREESKARGEMPGSMEGTLAEILKPKVDWRTALISFVKRAYGDGHNTWSLPNKRLYASGYYLPSKQTEKLTLGVVVDTSGSTANDLPTFLGELNGLVKMFPEYELTLVQVDIDIKSIETFSNEKPFVPEKYVFSGGGGTVIAPGIKHFDSDENPVDAIVVFTDGYCESIGEGVIERPIPILWMITNHDTHENITVGTQVEYDLND